MPEKHNPQPRWWRLYLVLPLAAGLFWLIERAQPTDVVRRSLEIGAVLIIFGYIELWRLANTVTLLHHPLEGKTGAALYHVWAVTPPDDRDAVDGRTALPTYAFYSDLFTVSVPFTEPLPPRIDQALAERPDA